MKRCKVCKRPFILKAKNKYVFAKRVSFFARSTIVNGSEYYEAFDCPYCGCQNIVNIREGMTHAEEEAQNNEEPAGT